MKKNLKHTIGRIRQGDPKGMSELYDVYAAPLYGVIHRIIADDQLAQDALQDTFVKVWRNFDRYDENRAQLFTWMYQIARNTALDHQKKANKNQTAEIQNSINDVSQSTMMNVEAIDVVHKLDALPEKYRSVLYALFFEGYSQREWSKASGLPLGTIKTRLRIGLRELKEVYAKGILIAVIITILSIC